MIGVLFGKAGRMMCGMKSDEKIAPERERLAGVLGAMLLLTLMAEITIMSLSRTGRIDFIDKVILLLAVSMPWIVFELFILPSSRWLSSDDSK